MAARAWLTPDGSIPSSQICLRIAVPDGLEWRAALRGAIVSLAEEQNWEQFGSVTPEEAAMVFEQSFRTAEFGECNGMIGEIKIWPVNDVPPGFLLCDGSVVSRDDYPALYDVIGTLYGETEEFDEFLLPDLIGRFPRGQTGAFVGQSGGNETHNHALSYTARTNTDTSDFRVVGYAGSGATMRSFGLVGSETINQLLTGATVDTTEIPKYVNVHYIIRAQ